MPVAVEEVVVWTLRRFRLYKKGVAFNGLHCISKIVATRRDHTLQKFEGKKEAEQVRTSGSVQTKVRSKISESVLIRNP